MRLTQEGRKRRVSVKAKSGNTPLDNLLRGQQNRYFTFCNNNTQGHQKVTVSLPKLKFLEKDLNEEEVLGNYKSKQR